MAISRILSADRSRRDDHLSQSDCSDCPATVFSGIKRRYSCRGATVPEDEPRNYFGAGGPAVLPLFCLAPHGVFRASRIASRAVSSYLAFSPLPALCCQRTGGIFSVTLSVIAVFQL